MGSNRGRTYRVPRRVMDAVRSGVRSYMAAGDMAGDEDALRMARTLTSDEPVDIAVPALVGGFFSDGWERDPGKTRVAGLYGGEIGRAWALKCVVAAGLVAAGEPGSVSGNESVDGPVEPAGVGYRGWIDDVPAMLDLFMMDSTDLEDLISVDIDTDEEEPAAGSPEVLDVPGEGGAPAVGVVDIDGVPVDTRLPGVVDVDADTVMDGVPFSGSPGVAMVQDDDPDDAGFTVAAMRDAIAAAELAVGAAAEGGGGTADAAVDGGGGGAGEEEPVPAGGGDHHAERQLRDYHGRFAKPGARVQGRGGNLGWVKGSDGEGAAVVTLDDGSEVTVDPKEMQVVSAQGRARLAPAPVVVEDPAARLEAYQEWAVEQLAGGGAA